MLAIFITNKIQVKSLLVGDDSIPRKNLLMMAMRACFDPIMFSNIFYYDLKKVEEVAVSYFRKLSSDGFFNNYETFNVSENSFYIELKDTLSNLKAAGVMKSTVDVDLDDLILRYNLVVRDVTKYSLYDITRIIIPLEVRLIFNRSPMKKIEELRSENPDLVKLYEDRVLDSVPETLLMKYLRSEFPNEVDLYNFFKRFQDRRVDYQMLRENFDLEMMDEKILRAIKYWKPESLDLKTYKYVNFLNDINSDTYDREALLLQLSGEVKVDKVEDWSNSIESLL